MSNRENPLAVAFVYSTMIDHFMDHVTPAINDGVMEAAAPGVYARIANFMWLGIREDTILFASALALRHAWRAKVQGENLTPERIIYNGE